MDDSRVKFILYNNNNWIQALKERLKNVTTQHWIWSWKQNFYIFSFSSLLAMQKWNFYKKYFSVGTSMQLYSIWSEYEVANDIEVKRTQEKYYLRWKFWIDMAMKKKAHNFYAYQHIKTSNDKSSIEKWRPTFIGKLRRIFVVVIIWYSELCKRRRTITVWWRLKKTTFLMRSQFALTEVSFYFAHNRLKPNRLPFSVLLSLCILTKANI